jgi:outer membrane protein OmpA-like peptidoglycan-associated protein
MANLKLLFLAVGFVSLAPSLYAQTDSVALAEEYYKQGMEVFDFSHRKQAAELFVLSTKMNPKSAKAQLMAGQCIMLSIQKEQSLEYFRKAWKLDPNVHEDILYFIGQAFHYSEKFDSAIQFYDRYNRLLARSLKFDKSVKTNEVNRKIFECRNGIIYKANPTNVTIEDLDDKVNSEYPDYAPTISADESTMVFTTRRPDNNANAKVAADHEYYEEILTSKKVNGVWQAAVNPGAPLNGAYHNASVNISPDGKELILYSDANGGDLMLSTLNQSGVWSSPKAMEGINTEYIENSASITNDDQHIYFTSNRPGGYGGTDIYHADLGKNGRWVNVKNLGPLVNTEMDEDGVFISANGKHLFFSSNGLAGMGDLDIYRTTYDDSKKEWGDPINLGYPINSTENDIYFVLTADEKHAYFSSLRKADIGEQDIYKINMENWKPVDLNQPQFAEVFAEQDRKRQEAIASVSQPVPVATKEVETAPVAQAVTKQEEKIVVVPVVAAEAKPASSQVTITYFIVDDKTNEPLQADLRLSHEKGTIMATPGQSRGTYTVSFTHSAGKLTRYKFDVGSSGYLPYSSSLYMQGATDGNQTIADTLRLNKAVMNVGYVLNVYFPLNDVTPISVEGIQNLSRMLNNSASMRVEIGGHTDDLGTPAYNQQLSERRANAVKNYLVKMGGDPKRITAVGYGETKPVVVNDSKENRRLNRRTEFVILQP